MDKKRTNRKYIFIDESGDPDFYASGKRLLVGTPGFQPYLIIGMIETTNRRNLYKAVAEFVENIKNDRLFNTIPSVCKKDWYLHAKSDHPEVRAAFFQLLRRLDGFTASIVIGKKDLDIFNNKHNNNASEFYFDLVHHLLKGKLDSADTEYSIFLSQRSNNTLQLFNNAVVNAISADNKKRAVPLAVDYKLEIIPSLHMCELSIVDYLLWAIQRKLLKGESRFFDALEGKYKSIINLYEDG